MARPVRLVVNELLRLLQARGPISATELALLTKTNPSTITRSLPALGDALVTVGATRGTRYLLRREVRTAGNRWPVYAIDDTGRPTLRGTLEALHPDRWRMIWADAPPEWVAHFTDSHGLWQGFPFFLSDVRPQGFLGRAIARELGPSLQVPEDPRRWSDDDILIYLQAAGEDLPGHFIVGDACMRRALGKAHAPTAGQSIGRLERLARYPVMAERAASAMPGSSAGGEHPKFLVTLRGTDERSTPVLVKFSPPMDQAVGQRWADLLLAEYHAHRVLAEAGLSSPAELLDAGGRRFLEIPRFDRQDAGGRSGVVSLEALYFSAIGGHARDWPAAAVELKQRGLIAAHTVERIGQLHAFGELIGNSDMHFGNLAFRLTDSLPLSLTPAYDMLPMLWAPGPQGELVKRAFTPLPPLPGMKDAWTTAATWAARFWADLAGDSRASLDFANQAKAAGETLKKLREFVGT